MVTTIALHQKIEFGVFSPSKDNCKPPHLWGGFVFFLNPDLGDAMNRVSTRSDILF